MLLLRWSCCQSRAALCKRATGWVNDFICQSANSLPVINRGLLLGAAEEAALLPAQEEGTGWVSCCIFQLLLLVQLLTHREASGHLWSFLCGVTWAGECFSLYRREFVTNLGQMSLPRLMRLPLTRLCFCHVSCELDEIGSQKCLVYLGCIYLCREVGFCSTVIAMLKCE